jgi:predicted amino acid racemase
MKPELQMDIKGIKKNAMELVKKAREQNITVTGITKGVCGNIDFSTALVEAGVDYLGDSRIENLKKMISLDIKKMLLRSPKISEVVEVVQYADYSLNSELRVIKALSDAALLQDKIHNIILMIDVGDLREGIWFNDEQSIYQMINDILQLKGVHLVGIGTNLTCFGGVIPTPENYGIITRLANEIRQTFEIELPIVSGGNSSSLHMLYDGTIPVGINNLRVNQAIFLGMEIAHGHYLKHWESDVLRLKAEIIELQTKPSLPRGEIAYINAFGKPISPKDKGIRKRAILAVGRQDIDIKGLRAIDKGITVEGASSDHLIIDVTESEQHFEVGDMVHFQVITYASVLSGMASNYIEQVSI